MELEGDAGNYWEHLLFSPFASAHLGHDLNEIADSKVPLFISPSIPGQIAFFLDLASSILILVSQKSPGKCHSTPSYKIPPTSSYSLLCYTWLGRKKPRESPRKIQVLSRNYRSFNFGGISPLDRMRNDSKMNVPFAHGALECCLNGFAITIKRPPAYENMTQSTFKFKIILNSSNSLNKHWLLKLPFSAHFLLLM